MTKRNGEFILGLIQLPSLRTAELLYKASMRPCCLKLLFLYLDLHVHLCSVNSQHLTEGLRLLVYSSSL